MYVFETPEEAIVRLHQKGLSIRKIKAELRTGTDRIQNTIKYFKMFNEIPETKKRGRPSKETEVVLNMIATLTINNRTMSCYQIAKSIIENGQLNISDTTMYRYRLKLQFRYKPPKIRQVLQDYQIFNRLRFSHSMLVSDINMSKIVFSDESRFCLDNDNVYRWYRKGEISDNIFWEKSKFNCGVMVFAAIGFNYKSKIVFCEKTINDMEYRNVIEKSLLIEDLDKMHGQGQYIFMQDGASAHCSFLSTLYLKKRLSFLKYWPSNSPDLNPIEHLWGAIKRILKTLKIKSKEELIEKVTTIWEAFPQSAINNLVLSFHGRLRTVIYQNGNSISEMLRNGIKFAPEVVLPFREDILKVDELISFVDTSINDNPIEFKTKRPFSPEEDILLLQSVKSLGNKWSLISKSFEDRTPTSLRQRYTRLRK